MNLVKKSIAALLCTAVCTSAGVTAFAAESQDVALSHVVENDPVYSLTIPSSLDMEKNGSGFTFEATGVQYMDGKKISVTIGGTDYFRNQMVLVDDDTRATLRYQIITADGRTLETTGQKDQMNGQEVASFTGDGTVSCIFKPVYAFNVVPGSYAGSITFNVDVVELA